MPDGDLYRWAGGSTGLNGTLVAELPNLIYQTPQLLTNATGIRLDHTYDLNLIGGSDYYNWGGEGERWVRGFRGADGSSETNWFFVKEDGSFSIWGGDRDLTTSAQVANAGSDAWQGHVGLGDEDGLADLHAQDEYFSDWETLLSL